MQFSKSDLGAQASWKGYSSQTLYIASRIVQDHGLFEYFPEQLEDLLIKCDGEVSEIIQIKDLEANLSISNLSSTSSSMNNEGFFRRVLSLQKKENKPIVVKVVHFGELGDELLGLAEKRADSLKKIEDKLIKHHGILKEEAKWLMDRMVFEKANKDTLQLAIEDQIKGYIPTMIASNIMQDFLIQYVSNLSKTKGFTSKAIWLEKIHQIGNDMASLDGYFREYGSSLIRLSDIKTHKSYDELKLEYTQGVSAHPAHIRSSLDVERINWLRKIKVIIAQNKAVIVKGASGQGKTSLCYKYLFNNFPEELVFCVRQIQTQGQAENLVKAISGLSKHSEQIALYIDVNSGQLHWTWLLRELQIRGIKLPIIVSIREEDFKQSNVDMSEVTFELIELMLSEDEAIEIYNIITRDIPHNSFRTFEEAWRQFGYRGPLLEFMYLLNNNETLKHRLNAQINRLIDESPEDSWLNLLLLVCYAGKLDIPVRFDKVKQVVKCNTIVAALKRMSDEYLIRRAEDGKFIVALHPLRAEIIYYILINHMIHSEKDILLQSLNCVETRFPQILLFHYFTNNDLNDDLISEIAKIRFEDWVAYGNTLNTMLWLDVKQYVEENQVVLESLVSERGTGWLPFMPIDITGELCPGVFAATSLIQINSQILPYLERIKKSLTSYVLSYSITDRWLNLSCTPKSIPINDFEWSSFGYTLFWSALRKKQLRLHFEDQEIISQMSAGGIESKVDAVSGMHQQGFQNLYNKCEMILRERIIKQYKIIKMGITDFEVDCSFVPPFFRDGNEKEKHENLNHYWTMNMMKLLSRLYPSKDSIAVQLVGIDLLREIGINPLDYTKRILKKDRPDQWITEVNSLLIARIELIHRPNDWTPYLEEVSTFRKLTVEILDEFIKLIDSLYKKRYWDNTKAKTTMSKIQSLQKICIKEFLLPKNVLDPYGLNSEGSSLNSKLIPQNTNISIQPYKNLKKALRQLISGLQNFLNQFIEVVVSRIKNEDIQSNLSLRNFYEAAKGMQALQEEYKSLFLPYTDRGYSNFANQEKDLMLTALNLWGNVLEQKLRGFGLSYNARQRFEKSEVVINDGFKRVISSLSPKILVFDSNSEEGNGTKYLLFEDLLTDNNKIEDQYKFLIREFREAWSSALNFNSSMWVLETCWPKMVFVPLYKGLPIFGGFEIPIHQILDASGHFSSMFPVEIPQEIYSFYKIDGSPFSEWRNAIAQTGKLKLLSLQYNQVIEEVNEYQHVTDEGLSEYLSMLLAEIVECAKAANNDILKCITILNENESPEVQELLQVVINCLSELNVLFEPISLLQKVEDALEGLQQTIVAMILLTPYLKYNSGHE